MLSGVCRALAERGFRVLVLARRERDLGPGVRVLPADYTDADAYETALFEIARETGRPDLLITWIHSTAPHAADAASRILSPSRHVDVLGSASENPASKHSPAPGREEVVLGFKVESGTSRWLTHEEIVQGVMRAIDQPGVRTIVGQVRPWDARPG